MGIGANAQIVDAVARGAPVSVFPFPDLAQPIRVVTIGGAQAKRNPAKGVTRKNSIAVRHAKAQRASSRDRCSPACTFAAVLTQHRALWLSQEVAEFHVFLQQMVNQQLLDIQTL